MATWAIGDVHGCFRSLRELLGRAAISPRDRLWFVGDLVNRGPRSLETLRFVADLGERATVVLGNHDLHFLSRAAGVAAPRKWDDLDELLAAPDLESLTEWMTQRPLLFVEGQRVLVHAGLLASWDGDEAERRARRAESALRSGPVPYLRAFRPGLPERELAAEVEPEVLDDLRVFTLMRTVDATSEPVYDFTGPLGELPPGRRAWFDVAQRRSGELTIVCGHWAALGLLVRRDVVALDTGCAWGGRLTAIRLEDLRLEQVENLDR